MEDKASDAGRPVWHSPAWITAMVGLVSIFFTVPDVIGNYLAKKQDIELAQENVRLAELKNEDLEKVNQFKNLLTVLQQRSVDRAMVLRFIATTSDASDVRSWAESELKLLSHIQRSDFAQPGVPPDPAAIAPRQQPGG